MGILLEVKLFRLKTKGEGFMKKVYLFIFIGLILAFGVGLLTGRAIYHQPTKELCLGMLQNPENEAYLFEEDKCITNLDPEDEFDIDHFWFTFRSAPTIEEEIVMDDFADYLLMIRSKKLGVSTIHTYLWLTEDGAIAGQRDFDTHVIKEAKFISAETLDELFNFIKQHEK